MLLISSRSQLLLNENIVIRFFDKGNNPCYGVLEAVDGAKLGVQRVEIKICSINRDLRCLLKPFICLKF